MSRFKFLPALMIAGLLAACAQDMSSGGLSSTNPGSGSQMPQPANSLPPGDSVNAPIAGGTGVVGAAPVGPRVRRARPVVVSRATAVRTRRPVRHVRKVVRHTRPRAVAPATAPATTTPGTTPQ